MFAYEKEGWVDLYCTGVALRLGKVEISPKLVSWNEERGNCALKLQLSSSFDKLEKDCVTGCVRSSSPKASFVALDLKLCVRLLSPGQGPGGSVD